MADVINIGGNHRGYSHVVCGDCNQALFTIETEDVNGKPLFKFLRCEYCGAAIPINMTPVFEREAE